MVATRGEGPAQPGPADDLGQLLTLSVVDGDLVSLPRILLRFLAGPGERELDDLGDVFGAVSDAEMALDVFPDPSGSH